jgi:hypothetical protein
MDSVMPVCHVIVATVDDSLDSNIEGLLVPVIPTDPWMTIHSHWLFSPDELGGQFEARVLLITPEGDRLLEHRFPLDSGCRRAWTGSTLHVPVWTPGDYQLTLEWQELGQAYWHRCTVSWPFEIVFREHVVDKDFT